MRDHVNVLGSHQDTSLTSLMTTAQTILDAGLTVLDVPSSLSLHSRALLLARIF
jgi:hypothetical protein